MRLPPSSERLSENSLPSGRRAWISALGGVKTAWGKNDLAQGGARLDEHLQPGTGSTDWFGGLSSVYLLDSRSSLFGSAQVRRTGANDLGYRYGGSTLLNSAISNDPRLTSERCDEPCGAGI